MTSLKDFPDSRNFEPDPNGEEDEFDSAGYIEAISVWFNNLKKELREELAPKINPKYAGWGTAIDDAKAQVYKRVLEGNKA